MYLRKSEMMRLRVLHIPVVGALALAFGATLPVAAQGDRLAMLGNLAKGEWTIKPRDGSGELKICLRTGEELIQLRHEALDCNRFVVEDQPSEVTVQYTCPGDGYGMTSIRRETNALVQIDSQGIASGLPFEFSAEARLTGAC
jgi:hypothetical protein